MIVRSFLFGLLKFLFYMALGLVVLMVLFLAFFLNDTLFGSDPLPWEFSIDYSQHLIVQVSDYEDKTGNKSIDTVDAISIYKVSIKKDEWYTLRELLEEDLVFETKDKRRIREFILAAREELYEGFYDKDTSDPNDGGFHHLEACYDYHEKHPDYYTYYVVMFDNRFMRVGLFNAIECKSHGKQYLDITVNEQGLFDATGYYNLALLKLFKPFLE